MALDIRVSRDKIIWRMARPVTLMARSDRQKTTEYRPTSHVAAQDSPSHAQINGQTVLRPNRKDTDWLLSNHGPQKLVGKSRAMCIEHYQYHELLRAEREARSEVLPNITIRQI